MKYSLSPRAELEVFPMDSGYISLYILTQDIIQTLPISKNDASSFVLPCWPILEELTFSHGHLPEAGRELQTDSEIRMMRQGGVLAKNQSEASPRARAVGQL